MSSARYTQWVCDYCLKEEKWPGHRPPTAWTSVTTSALAPGGAEHRTHMCNDCASEFESWQADSTAVGSEECKEAFSLPMGRRVVG